MATGTVPFHAERSGEPLTFSAVTIASAPSDLGNDAGVVAAASEQRRRDRVCERGADADCGAVDPLMASAMIVALTKTKRRRR